MSWSWYYVAQYIIEPVYGGYVDWEEEYYICPECGEPIYRSDYPTFDIHMICPVCEIYLDDEEES